MKKIMIMLAFTLAGIIVSGQATFKTNVTITKTTPTLYFNGTGGILDFNSNNMRLTHSTGVLTLSGGNFGVGSGSILGTGSLGATGGRFLKGWFTDLEITNLPTVNGGTLAAALSLSNYLLKTDTTAMILPYIRAAEVTSLLLGKVNVSDTSNMLTKYARKASPTFTGVPAAPTASLGTNTTQIATTAFVASAAGLKVNIADTANMLADYINKADTSAMLDTYIDNTELNDMSEEIADLNLTQYDYIIEKVSSTYYARPTGSLTAYSNADATVVIQGAIDELTNGGSIFIKKGTYDGLDQLVISNDKISIHGAGKYLTTLKLKNSADAGTKHGNMFYVGGEDYFELKYIGLNGNGQNQTKLDTRDGDANATSVAIYARDTIDWDAITYMNIIDCYITDFAKTGIVVAGGGTGVQVSKYILIDRCVFENNYWSGVEFYPYTEDCVIDNCLFNSSALTFYGNKHILRNSTITNVYNANNWHDYDYAITLEDAVDGPDNITIENVSIYNDSTDYAIYCINGANNLKIKNVRMFGPVDVDDSQLIRLRNDTCTVIDGLYVSEFRSNGGVAVSIGDTYNAIIQSVVIDTVKYGGIWLNDDTHNSVIRDCNIYSTDNAIVIDAGAENNIIWNNIVNGDGLDINNSGTNTILFNNYSRGNNAWRIEAQAPRNTGTVGTSLTVGAPIIYYSEGAASDLTADPQIVDGIDGQIVTIIGSSDSNTLTLDDGTGLLLTAQCVLGQGDSITLIYSSTLDKWVEISRANN